ncbi:MAG TPA: hypothetical protein VMD30_07515, partial [Tepidisphaeraceae bacterium]|nr:hypothetical protein [Tepidisphaeraceae bacterium]
MNRLLETLLGLDRGWLSQSGQWSLQFHPNWPFQDSMDAVGGAAFYNVMLALLGLALVIYVYRREGRSRLTRIALGSTRVLLGALVIFLLNRPTLVFEQEHREPSVVAIMLDDTISMSVPDMGSADQPISRIAAAQQIMTGDNADFLRRLASV